ncbi:hypothetical protein F5878DRAFT_192018 [Lentinula raphanica]|uniref:Tat pathway signal sequence n=1 Tax=Lentinula raphanica TaxID=153919 RepID=A0AA38UDJ0_9AGAR|nr:hypothetical protein F5878DRAFT_192018 [Lentinula raphanica]
MFVSIAPAKEVAFGQAKVFDLSPENASDYSRGHSDEVNELWRSLYKAGISSLTPEEQTNLQLVGVDADEIARRPEKLIQLAVFHDMHCVNKLRQRLFPDYYTDPSLLLGTWHMDHCIDALRQTIMCSGDITPVVWRWNYAMATAMRDASVMHQCRDFDRVQEWAMKRAPEV